MNAPVWQRKPELVLRDVIGDLEDQLALAEDAEPVHTLYESEVVFYGSEVREMIRDLRHALTGVKSLRVRPEGDQ